MPDLSPGIYGIVVDSLSATFPPVTIEMGDLWVIDTKDRRVLHYGYVSAGPGAGIGGIGSRQFGAVYISEAAVLTGLSVSFSSDGALGIGGSGTADAPPLALRSTTASGGPSVGFGVGLSVLGSITSFKKVYSFDEAPGNLPISGGE